MPKPMFLTIGVEEAVFGKIFRMLDTMPGVASIKINGEGAAEPRKKGAPKSNGGPTAAYIMLATMKAKPGVHLNVLQDALTKNGKKPSGAASGLYTLVQEKLAKSDGKGHYRITPKGVAYLNDHEV